MQKKQYLCGAYGTHYTLKITHSPTMSEQKGLIYQQTTIEFVTVAAQLCLLLEHLTEHEKDEAVDQLLCLLPLLYLKTRLLERKLNPAADKSLDTDTPADTEPKEDWEDYDEAQRFVMEEDYNYIAEGMKQLLGSDDAYLEVFVDDMRYSDEPVTAYISENIADIYQEVKDMAAAFQTGQEAVMKAGVAACVAAFRDHWGQKLLNAMRALHTLENSQHE